MKNFIQRGDMITVTAPTGGVTSGQGVLVGNLFGVAAATAAEGESIEIATVGVYELPKLVSAADCPIDTHESKFSEATPFRVSARPSRARA